MNEEEIKVIVYKFENKKTKEIGYCVNQVGRNHYIYDGSEWKLLDKFEVEGFERVIEYYEKELKDDN
jgi:hypothetical protein